MGLPLNELPWILDRPSARRRHGCDLKVFHDDDAVFLGELRGCLVQFQQSCRSAPGSGPQEPGFTARERMSKVSSKQLCLACIGKLSRNLRILPYDDIDLSQAVDRDFGHCSEILNTRREKCLHERYLRLRLYYRFWPVLSSRRVRLI